MLSTQDVSDAAQSWKPLFQQPVPGSLSEQSSSPLPSLSNPSAQLAWPVPPFSDPQNFVPAPLPGRPLQSGSAQSMSPLPLLSRPSLQVVSGASQTLDGPMLSPVQSESAQSRR